jgi:hypothetical protein
MGGVGEERQVNSDGEQRRVSSSDGKNAEKLAAAKTENRR